MNICLTYLSYFIAVKPRITPDSFEYAEIPLPKRKNNRLPV
jgi:hypothetical protein